MTLNCPTGADGVHTTRPHSALGYRPAALGTIIPMVPRPIMHSHSNWTTWWGLVK